MKDHILFDHDGVLVETEPLYYASNARALAELGVSFSREQCVNFMADGVSCWTLARSKGIPEAEIAEARKRRDAYYQAFLKAEDIEIPGVLETLEELAKDFRMGIVTTAKRRDFDVIHEHRTIMHWMEFVLTMEDYAHSKPAPDPYLAGLERFAASPRQAVAVEDSARGLKSALAAGLACIIVENAFTRQHDFTGAALVIETFSELPDAIRKLST
jgi:HAD superfamily hydrolase (TIGR01509 family)